MFRSVAFFLLASFAILGSADQSPTGADSSESGHHLLLGAADRLVVTDPRGDIVWEMPWGSIHDIHVTDRGTILTARGKAEVVEIDPKTRQVVWSYDCDEAVKQPVEVHSFYPLGDGIIRIAQSGPSRLVDVDRDGEVVGVIPLTVKHPSLHSDTRLIRPVGLDSVLVAHERDGVVRSYDAEGTVNFTYEIPMFGKTEQPGHGPKSFGNAVFAAVKTGDNHYLITSGNGHSILKVDSEGELVQQIAQNDLPDVQLSWVTTVEELPSGHWLVGNCHAGPNQPIVLEIDPAEPSVVWQLDGYDRFGNNVSSWTRLTPAQIELFRQ